MLVVSHRIVAPASRIGRSAGRAASTAIGSCTRPGASSAAVPTSCVQVGVNSRLHASCRLGIFAASIDLEQLASATAEGGFGALKCRKKPLERCPSSIDQAYVHRAEQLGCVNPEFFEPLGGDAFRVIARIPI